MKVIINGALEFPIAPGKAIRIDPHFSILHIRKALAWSFNVWNNKHGKGNTGATFTFTIATLHFELSVDLLNKNPE